jgi:hypothetical protein
VEWESPDRLPRLAEDLQDFTRETGIQVKRLPGPDGSLTQLALWRQLLQKGSGAPDVCSIDVIWSGILNPYLTDLRPYFGRETASKDPAVVAGYIDCGGTAAIDRLQRGSCGVPPVADSMVAVRVSADGARIYGIATSANGSSFPKKR